MKKWISNGAEHSFHIQLINIYELLNKYLLVTRVVNPQLNRMDNMELDDDFEVMRQQLLLSNLRDYSIYEIYNIVDIAKILMCIDLEMRINKLCYYNLDEDVFEAIEKLDIVNKLIVVVFSINSSKIKGTKIYENLKEFKEFRNSYAHGKVPIIATKEFDEKQISEKKLKDNRISEVKHEIMITKSLIEQINALMKMCEKYLLIIEYMEKINKDDEKIFDSIDINDLKFFINEIKKRCNIIDKSLELDDDVKRSLQSILDKLYIDIIRV